MALYSWFSQVNCGLNSTTTKSNSTMWPVATISDNKPQQKINTSLGVIAKCNTKTYNTKVA